MNKLIPSVFALMVLLLIAAPALAEGTCTENWSDMASVVTVNQLVASKDLPQLSHGKVPGKLIKVSLCQIFGDYTYELVFLEANGQLINLAVDARNPFPK